MNDPLATWRTLAENPMESKQDSHLPVEESRSTSRRTSIAKMIIFLLFVAIAFMIFNFLLGDFRRKQNALAQAQMLSEHYAQIAGDSKKIPLNLEPKINNNEISKMFRMEWLSSDDVRKFRDSESPVIIAQTIKLPLFLSANGRAVVIYDKGQYSATWMTASEFDRQLAQQQSLNP